VFAKSEFIDLDYDCYVIAESTDNTYKSIYMMENPVTQFEWRTPQIFRTKTIYSQLEKRGTIFSRQ
jgi:hypothetical protein